MNRLSAEILSLTAEAAVIVEKNRISFANTAAMEILGSNCLGKTVAMAFGADVAGNQASSFMGDISINGRHYVLRVSKSGEGQIYMFSAQNFSADIMNTPFLYCLQDSLSTIGLCLERLREGAEDGGSSAMLADTATMTRNYYRMLRLVNNATALRALAEGNMSHEFAMMNISEIYSEKMHAVSELVRNVHFSTEFGRDICLNADYALVNQLLMNLVSNALVHATGCDRIGISLTESENSVILSVSDNGQGIRAADMYSIFERYKHSFSISEIGKGAGLGMSVCAGISRLHGGTLLIESREGQGTTVRASLSKKLKAGFALHEPSERLHDTKTVLMGLSDVLPAECFSEKYMD